MIPPDSHSGRGRPPPAPNTQPGLWPGAGQAPRCWNSNLGPPQLFSRGCDPDYDAQHKDQVGHTIRSVTVLQRFYCWYLILLRCYLDLWPWTFVMYIACDVVKLYTKCEFVEHQMSRGNIGLWVVDNLANFCTSYVMLWHRPLTSELWTFVALRVLSVQSRRRPTLGWLCLCRH